MPLSQSQNGAKINLHPKNRATIPFSSINCLKLGGVWWMEILVCRPFGDSFLISPFGILEGDCCHPLGDLI